MATSKKAKTTKNTPKPKYQYDAVVIGTGPGGEGVAMQLSKAGKSVAVVEKHHTVGGRLYPLGDHSFQGPKTFRQPSDRIQ